MASYARGAMGPEVERIQARLKELGHYLGPVDGAFGAGTMIAAKAFQRKEGLEADGVVGPISWGRLFGVDEPPPPPQVVSLDLAERCLALTGAFETSMPPPECFCGLSGDFDDQGLSFGALQWCLGQGSLQPLLQAMDKRHPQIIEEIFDDYGAELRAMMGDSREDQMTWSRRIQGGRGQIAEPWRGMFKTLGRRKECQRIQVEAASGLFRDAATLCRRYGLRSQRAMALMFDIKVQNGSISPLVEAQIRRDFDRIAQAGSGIESEEARLIAIAERRSAAANPRWVEDVRRRKLTIAKGQGTVHGNRYDIAAQYGITLDPAKEL